MLDISTLLSIDDSSVPHPVGVSHSLRRPGSSQLSPTPEERRDACED